MSQFFVGRPGVLEKCRDAYFVPGFRKKCELPEWKDGNINLNLICYSFRPYKYKNILFLFVGLVFSLIRETVDITNNAQARREGEGQGVQMPRCPAICRGPGRTGPQLGLGWG